MRTLITCLLISLTMAALASQSGHAGRQDVDDANMAIVAPIFAERPIRVQRARDLFKGWPFAVDKTIPVVSFGTGFLYATPDFHAMITAAHVVEFPPDVKSVADSDGAYSMADGYGLERRPARIRIGGLSLKPVRILVDHKLDIAVLELDDATVQLLKLRALAPGKAVVDREAKTWGFPAIPSGVLVDGEALASTPSASQTSQRCDITDVRPGEVICTTLNGVETRGGYSGGPLIDSNRDVIGMISRSTPVTTRCRSISAIDGVIARFASESRTYSD